MKTVELIAPCHFGLEAVLKREIRNIGYEISRVDDGRVTFWGDLEAVAYANVFLRTAERVLLKIGEIHAETFDELFERTKELPWEEYIPRNGKFWVAKATSIRSKLFSPSDIQSIMKKAIVERLKKAYGIEWFTEDGESYPIRVTFLKDQAVIGLDTTGVSLHKRGYRQMTAKAPITETLAAALILLTPWDENRILVDVLRKRHLSDRGGDDGGEYCSGYEPGVFVTELGTSGFQKILVCCAGRSPLVYGFQN